MREYIEYITGLHSVCKHIHPFLNDPVRAMLSYLCESRPWLEKIAVIAHNAKAFDLHFIQNRVILLKRQMELIMNGMNVMSMRVENLVFSAAFLSYRKLPKRLG